MQDLAMLSMVVFAATLITCEWRPEPTATMRRVEGSLTACYLPALPMDAQWLCRVLRLVNGMLQSCCGTISTLRLETALSLHLLWLSPKLLDRGGEARAQQVQPHEPRHCKP